MSPRRQLVLAVVLLAVLGTWDFVVRVHVPRDDSLRGFVQPELVPLPTRPDANSIRKELVAWMPGLAGMAGVATPSADPTGWDLTLVGVFRTDKGRFAVVHAQPRTGGGTPEMLWLGEGDEAHGLKVAEIGARRLKLTQDSEVRELLLFEQGRTPLATATAAAVQPARPAARPSGTMGPSARRARIEALRARQRANEARAAELRPAPAPRRTAAGPGTDESGDSQQSPNASPSGRKSVQPQELQPGEEVKLPWDLPVVEGGGPEPGNKQ